MNEPVTQAWHDQAQRSLDAMHERAERAEKIAQELYEALLQLVEGEGRYSPGSVLQADALARYEGEYKS